MNKVYPVIWKELRDMLRDIRTLTLIASLPLIIMPLMGLSTVYMQQLQVSNVVVVDEDLSSINMPGLGNISSHDLVT
ncbi:MAG TPA: ABC transporter permease, partial [Acidilobales archaeon]|nr:ABC transporter permease [Acidilobales archaeon]